MGDESESKAFDRETTMLWDIINSTEAFEFVSIQEENIRLRDIIDDEIAELQETVAKVQDETEENSISIADVKKKTDENKNSILNVNKTLDNSLEEVNKSLNETTYELNRSFNETTNELTEDLAKAEENLNKSLNETTDDLNRSLNETKDELTQALDSTEEKLQGYITGLQEDMRVAFPKTIDGYSYYEPKVCNGREITHYVMSMTEAIDICNTNSDCGCLSRRVSAAIYIHEGTAIREYNEGWEVWVKR